jgi:hypothetical protein
VHTCVNYSSLALTQEWTQIENIYNLASEGVQGKTDLNKASCLHYYYEAWAFISENVKGDLFSEISVKGRLTHTPFLSSRLVCI